MCLLFSFVSAGIGGRHAAASGMNPRRVRKNTAYSDFLKLITTLGVLTPAGETIFMTFLFFSMGRIKSRSIDGGSGKSHRRMGVRDLKRCTIGIPGNHCRSLARLARASWHFVNVGFGALLFAGQMPYDLLLVNELAHWRCNYDYN